VVGRNVRRLPYSLWEELIMADEMITAEYIGRADRSAGPGWLHEVRVFWRVVGDDSLTKAKRAARTAVRRENKGATSIRFSSMDLDTYGSPQLAAIMRYRVI
jgi:hypothetical protein